MAEEKVKDKTPPITDEWRPRGSGRAGRKKPFGLLVTYGPTIWKREILEWKQWYPTERAREQAATAIRRKRTFGKTKYTATPIA